MSSDPVALASPQQLGRYRLIETIAAGAMSTVYRAERSGPSGSTKTVAIKRLHPHLADNKEIVSTFLDQVRITSCIQHTNVVPTSELVDEEGELYFVLEYVQGKTLAVLLETAREKKAPVPLNVAAVIALELLRGLNAAHEALDSKGEPLHVVHRDVNPHHIMVGTDGVTRILDFGAAKADGAVNALGDGGSTSAYMAPEQARGTLVDRRADVYASAAVLWEILVGRRMVEGKNDEEVFDAIVRGEVVDPSSLEPRIPAPLAAAITRGLADDIEKRWPTARDFAVAIEQAQKPASAKDVAAWVASPTAAPLEATPAPPPAATPKPIPKVAPAPRPTPAAFGAPRSAIAAIKPDAPPKALPSSAKLRAAPALPRAPASSTKSLTTAAAQPFPPSPSAPLLAAAPAAEPPPSPFPPSPSAPMKVAPDIAPPDPHMVEELTRQVSRPEIDDLLLAANAEDRADGQIDDLLFAANQPDPFANQPDPFAGLPPPPPEPAPEILELPAIQPAMPAEDLEPLAPVVPQRKLPILVLIGGVVAVVAVVLVLVLVIRRAPTPPKTPVATASVPAATSVETPPPPPPPPAPAPPPAPEPAATESVAAAPPDPPPVQPDEPDHAPPVASTKPPPVRTAVTNTAPPVAPAPGTKPKPTPKKKTCAEDPFFIGPDGLKRVRPECMK